LMVIATVVNCHLQIGHLFFLSAIFWEIFTCIPDGNLQAPSSRSIWSHVSCTMYLSHVLSSHAFFEKFWRQWNFKHHHGWRSSILSIMYCPLSILRMTNSLTCKLQTNAVRPSTRGNFLHGARHHS
jgi:hypothetical protein